MKINVLCNNDVIDGYVNVTIHPEIKDARLVKNYHEALSCDEGTVETIRCLYSLQKINPGEVVKTLEYWFDVLVSGGELYVEMIDNYLVSNNFVHGALSIQEYNAAIYGGNAVAFTIDSFQELITKIGFKVRDKGYYGNSFFMTLHT